MPTSAPLSRFAPMSGFTLVEVLAVLAIVAILVGLAMPAFGRTLERYRLRAAEEGLRAALYTARSSGAAAVSRCGGLRAAAAHRRASRTGAAAGRCSPTPTATGDTTPARP